MNHTRRLILSCLLLSKISFGQSGIQVPVAGDVLDAGTGTVRPVIGLPGSWLLGSPRPLGVSLRSARFAGHGDFALAVLNDTAQLVLATRLSSDAPQLTLVPDAIAADMIALDAGESTAALYSENTQQLQFVSGLPDAPIAHTPMSLAGLDGPVTALALAGSTVAIATSDGQSGSIYALHEQAAVPVFVTSVHRMAAVTFVGNGTDLAGVDQVTDELTLIRSFSTSPEPAVVATQHDGIARAVGLQAEGKRIFVANSGANTVVVLDLDTNLITPIELAITPSGLERLSSGWLLTNAIGSEPLYVVNPDDLGVLFVPVGD
jgi:YVTN family beta-propeller protein